MASGDTSTGHNLQNLICYDYLALIVLAATFTGYELFNQLYREKLLATLKWYKVATRLTSG